MVSVSSGETRKKTPSSTHLATSSAANQYSNSANLGRPRRVAGRHEVDQLVPESGRDRQAGDLGAVDRNQSKPSHRFQHLPKQSQRCHLIPPRTYRALATLVNRPSRILFLSGTVTG